MYRCEECKKLLVPRRGPRMCKGCGAIQSDDEQIRLIEALFEGAVRDLNKTFHEAIEQIKRSK